MKRFIVFGIPDCKWCDKARELDAEIEYIELTREQARTQGFKTVPAVYEFVGGYEEMEERIENDS